jgi:cell division protein FtsQ
VTGQLEESRGDARGVRGSVAALGGSVSGLATSALRAPAAVVAPVGRAARRVGRGVRRAVGRPRRDLEIDDPGLLDVAEDGVRRGAPEREAEPGPASPSAPPEPPPPRLPAWRIALAAVLLAAPLGTGGVALLRSDWLAVHAVSVAGTQVLDPAQVRSAAAVPEGAPLAAVDLDAVRTAVEAIPDVAAAEVTRRWPDELHVAVTERAPVTAVADDSGEYVLVDVTGTPFRTVPAPPPDVPLLAVPDPAPGDPATLDGLTVLTALPPELLTQVERVEVPAPGRVGFLMRDGARVVWGGADRSESKAVVLAALLTREAEEYDVSAPEVAVTRS